MNFTSTATEEPKGDLFVCGEIFGTRLLSEEQERELRARDAEMQWYMTCLDDLRTRTRLPCISIICSCTEGPRAARPLEDYSSSSSNNSDSDSDSDDGGFTLSQVLNAIDLYERKPLNKRSPKTLRNLVCSYTGQQDLEDGQVKRILELMQNIDPGLGEVAILLTRQLCLRENNAFKFLFHEGMKHIIDILADPKLHHLHEGAAQVIGKLARHMEFEDLWIDHMMIHGLGILTSRLAPGNDQNTQYACAQALSSLASHRNLALLIIDQATDSIRRFKDINADFKNVYAEIMTVLAQHTEHTRASILDVSSLPEAINMLKQGPCGSQKHALTLFATLAEKESGVKALVEEQIIQYTMSAFLDSECRHVRCTALTVLYNLLATPKISFQKQVLICIDHFMHGHEESYSILDHYAFNSQISRPGYRNDSDFRINRAVEDLSDVLVRQLFKEARLQKGKNGEVTEVNLAPGIDIDPVLLQTLTHLSQVITQIGHLRTFSVKLNCLSSQSANKEELRNITKYTMGRVNATAVKLLMDRGAACVLDILHVYVIKFNFLARSVLPVTGGKDVTSAEQLKGVLHAWEACMKETKPSEVELASIFCEGEVKLIRALLQAALMLAKCTCDNDIKNIHKEVIDKMEEFGKDSTTPRTGGRSDKRSHHRKDERVEKKVIVISSPDSKNMDGENCDGNISINKNCRCNKTGAYGLPESHMRDFMDKKATIQCQANRCKDDSIETITEAGMMFKEALNKELGPSRRSLRIKLFEAGIIDAIGPWLTCANKDIKELVFDTLKCLIQPIPEYVVPRPPGTENVQAIKRPMSAMTCKERDKALNVALHQMSSTMSSLMKDALGMDPNAETPRKPITKPPPSNMFTIMETKRNKKSTTVGRNNLPTDGTNLTKKDDQCSKSSLSEVGSNSSKQEELLLTANQEKIDDFVFESDVINTEESLSSFKLCQTLALPKGESVKENENLKSYQHGDYDKFARRPVRPQSAKQAQTRPSSAKVTLSKKARPQSAHTPQAARPASSTLTKRPSSAATSRNSSSVTSSRPSSASRTRIEVKKSAHASVVKTTVRCTEFNAFNPESPVHPLQRPNRARTTAPVPALPPALSPGSPPSLAFPNPASTPVAALPLPPQGSGDGTRQNDSVCVQNGRMVRSRSTTSIASDVSGTTQQSGSARSAKLTIQVTNSKAADSGGPVQIKRITPSPATPRKSPRTPSIWSTKVSEAKSRKALEEITRKMRTCVTWKPTFDKHEALRGQCCMRVAEVVGMTLCRDMLHKDSDTQRNTIVFLEQLVKQSETVVHMKLSECCIIPRLVDYLRINDDKYIEETLGLIMARLLVASDTRLKQLFNHHGGTRLLMAMASYAKGFLRQEVSNTLKTVTRGTTSTTVVIAGKRRVQSAPVGSAKAQSHPPDIWDKVMLGWKQEDKVTAILRKKLPKH